MDIETFEQLNINDNLKRAIIDMNYEIPTPIQAKAIPFILENRDVIGQAQTGTGKTAAFAIPILEKVDFNDYNIQALVMSPTRELAIQITKEIRKISKYSDSVRVVPVYGGQSYDIQINALKKKPQIIVGTPGRIIDLMKRSLLKFGNVNTVVLDEADEMLKMGFQEDLETILQTTPKDKQTVMFSATMPPQIKKIANSYLKEYEMIKVENKTVTVEKIDQTYYLCKNEQKMDLLVRLLDYYRIESAIIFSNTKRDVDDLVIKLQNQNYVTEGIHGDLKQSQRDRVMNSFRGNHVQILVATDVAARGLDVDNVGAVINYDCPLEEELYVHRIGRTGRAGKSGLAFTFVTKRQEYRIQQIEKYTNSKIKKGKIPSIEEIKYAKSSEMYYVIKENLEKNNTYELNEVIEKLIKDEYTKDQIINVMFHMLNQDTLKDYEEIDVVSFSERNEKKGRQKEFKDRRNTRGERENKNQRGSVNRDSRDSKPNKRKKIGKKVLVYLNIGTRQNIKVFDILDYLKNDFKIHKNDIGTIEITKKATYVELFENDAKLITNSSNQKMMNENLIQAEIIK